MLQKMDNDQNEYTQILAKDFAVVISAHKNNFPDLEWSSIQRAMGIVQAGLKVAQIGAK